MTLSLYLSRIISFRIFLAWTVLALLGLSIDLFRSATGLIEQGGAGALLGYAALRVPQIMVTLFPVAVLVGGTTGFLALGNHSELVIMRASGYGIFVILRRLLPLALILGVLYSQLGDRISSWAENGIATAFPQTEKAVPLGSWFWSRDGRDIIRARLGQDDGSQLTELTVFSTDNNGQVVSRLSAKKARFEGEEWILEDIARTENGKIVTLDRMAWRTRLVPESVFEIVRKSNLSSDDARAALAGTSVSVRSQAYYITRITRSYSSLAVPLVMLTLAALAGFGNGRGNNGVRLAAFAIVLGFSYIAADGLFGSLGEVGVIGPSLAAFAPSAVFAMLGVWVLLLLDE